MLDKKKTELLATLMARRDSLLGVVNNAESNREREAQADPTDIAVSTYHSHVLSSMSANDWAILELVNAAMRRIHEGEYGNCSACGDRIQSKRLEALPWANYCLDCQDLQEREGVVN